MHWLTGVPNSSISIRANRQFNFNPWSNFAMPLRFLRFAALTAAVSTGASICTVAAAELPTLKVAFADRFRVGAAIGTHQILGDDQAALELTAQQFNTVTPENLLKWQEVHPQPGQFNFEPADRFVEFGEQHGMFIVGHTLVWHNQTPDWVFQDDVGNPIDRETLLKRMSDHIHAVVGRYKGRIHAWDVVNEAIEDDGSMRKTKWQQIIGDDYIEKAFEFGHQADPQAELYYNDYNEWKPEKRRAIKQLVRRLQEKGIRIDGVGLQGHWGLNYPATDEINAMFADYGKLGKKLMITELDVTVLPDAQSHSGADITRNEALSGELNPYADELPDDIQQKLANRYAEIFELFVANAESLDRVTFWGVHDGHSWRNGWPVRGRSDHPLLFDRQYQPKPAFDVVIHAARK
jgi:endo-1,4-beta-xylanase